MRKKRKKSFKSRNEPNVFFFFSYFPFSIPLRTSFQTEKINDNAIKCAQIDHFSVSNLRVSFCFVPFKANNRETETRLDRAIATLGRVHLINANICEKDTVKLIVANELKTASSIKSCVFHWCLTRVTLESFATNTQRLSGPVH